MKFLFLFFIVLHLLIQTCYGRDVKPLNVVLINNLVDPNEIQVQTLVRLATFPFLEINKTALITHFGLIVNYTIMFSPEPDDIITLRGLDMDNYAVSYFQNLVATYTDKNCGGASLKSLQKALELTPATSLILMATNKRPKDLTLMLPILETMIAKVNPTIIFQISADGSMSDLSPKRGEINIDHLIPAYIQRNKVDLIPEYDVIMGVSQELIFLTGFQVLWDELNPLRMVNSLSMMPKISINFPTSSSERSVIFIYDVDNATDKELDVISRSINECYQLNNDRNPNSTFFHTFKCFIVISSHPTNVLRLDRSENYTPYEIKTIIKYHSNNPPLVKPSFHALLSALEAISRFSRIHYYVDRLHPHNEEMLIDILQLIKDKIINVKIYAHGNLKSKRLPVFYRTIEEASRMVSGAGSPYNSNHYLIAIIAFAFFVATSRRIVN